jgi:hypothetical protein
MSPGDLKFFATFAVITLALIILALAGLWSMKIRFHRILTVQEWTLLFKLVAIIAFTLILLQSGIAREMPAEMFIYGRF